MLQLKILRIYIISEHNAITNATKRESGYPKSSPVFWLEPLSKSCGLHSKVWVLNSFWTGSDRAHQLIGDSSGTPDPLQIFDPR